MVRDTCSLFQALNWWYQTKTAANEKQQVSQDESGSSQTPSFFPRSPGACHTAPLTEGLEQATCRVETSVQSFHI